MDWEENKRIGQAKNVTQQIFLDITRLNLTEQIIDGRFDEPEPDKELSREREHDIEPER